MRGRRERRGRCWAGRSKCTKEANERSEEPINSHSLQCCDELVDRKKKSVSEKGEGLNDGGEG